MTQSYAPEVQCDHSGKWYGNALRFRSETEAQQNVRDLASRWTLVLATRVVPSDDPPNYRWDDTLGLVRIACDGDQQATPDPTVMRSI